MRAYIYQQSLLKQFIQTVWGWGWWCRGGPNARWSSKCTRTPTTTCQCGPAPLTLTTQPQRRLTFHNHGSPHAKTSHITYVGTASLMTGASGAGEGEARANWCFFGERARALTLLLHVRTAWQPKPRRSHSYCIYGCTWAHLTKRAHFLSPRRAQSASRRSIVNWKEHLARRLAVASEPSILPPPMLLWRIWSRPFDKVVALVFSPLEVSLPTPTVFVHTGAESKCSSPGGGGQRGGLMRDEACGGTAGTVPHSGSSRVSLSFF